MTGLGIAVRGLTVGDRAGDAAGRHGGSAAHGRPGIAAADYDAGEMTSTLGRATTADGTELLTREWDPPAAAGPRWAELLLVHGLGEHSGRYEHVGERLAETGIAVHAYDQRGFGASGGRRAFVEVFGQFYDDLEERLGAVRSLADGRPVVLYGHSLGGLVAYGYAVSDRAQPDLLVLSAPALDSAYSGWLRALARVLSRIAPTLEIANGFDGSKLSRDPAVGERYAADPLNHHRSTTRLGGEGFAESARLRGTGGRLRVPTLVLHGDADRIVPPRATEALTANALVTRRLLPGLRHEVHNEPEGPAVLDEIVAWIREHMSRRD